MNKKESHFALKALRLKMYGKRQRQSKSKKEMRFGTCVKPKKKDSKIKIEKILPQYPESHVDNSSILSYSPLLAAPLFCRNGVDRCGTMSLVSGKRQQEIMQSD